MTYEMRALSTEEIDAVAGAGGSTNTITVMQSNSGMATATSYSGNAIAVNKQANNSIVLNQSSVKIEIGGHDR